MSGGDPSAVATDDPADGRRSAEWHVDADTLRVSRLLHVAAVGVLVAGPGEAVLHSAGASHPLARALDVLQAGTEAGPAYAALRGGTACFVTIDDDTRARWPIFAGALERSPFANAGAVLVTRLGRPIGVLTLYDRHAIRFSPASREYAFAALLAKVLVAAAVRERAMRDLRRTIAELGVLLGRVNQVMRETEAESGPALDSPVSTLSVC